MSGRWATGGSNTAGAKTVVCRICGESFYWPNPVTESERGYSTPVIGWECWHLFLRGYSWPDVVLIRKRETAEIIAETRRRLSAPGLRPPGEAMLPDAPTPPGDLAPPVKVGQPDAPTPPESKLPVNDSKGADSPCPVPAAKGAGAEPESPPLFRNLNPNS